MRHDVWIRWNTPQIIPRRYGMNLFKDDYSNNTLTLILSDDEYTPTIKVIFKNIYGYLYANESQRDGTGNYLHEKYGTNFCTDWVSFKVENSDFLNSFYTSNDDQNKLLIHFCFVFFDEILDVVALQEPTFELIPAKNQSPKSEYDARVMESVDPW